MARALFYILALVFIYCVQCAAGKIEQGSRFGEGPPGPFWYAATLGAIVAAIALERFLFFKKVRPADKLPRCRRCGYDLRETPDRCPECGMGSVYTTSDGFQRDQDAYSQRPESR
jgi:hypothetical protein